MRDEAFESMHPDCDGGLLTVVECDRLPFAPKRIFWMTGLREDSVRGEHAHLRSDQILWMIRGQARIEFERLSGTKANTLTSPSVGILLPKMTWIRLSDFEAGSLVLVAASEPYDPDEEIRDRKRWRDLQAAYLGPAYL